MNKRETDFFLPFPSLVFSHTSWAPDLNNQRFFFPLIKFPEIKLGLGLKSLDKAAGFTHYVSGKDLGRAGRTKEINVIPACSRFFLEHPSARHLPSSLPHSLQASVKPSPYQRSIS